MYEVIIVGGGPAGAAAAVYAARKKLKSLIIAETFGGQSVVSDDIGNWIGDVSVAGTELAKRFEEHVRAQEDLDVNTGERVEKITKADSTDGEPVFNLKTNKSEYQTRSVILCSGGRRRRLGVPGEDEFDGKGVAYCTTCDAPLFKGRKVVMVGSGNSGLEGILDLDPYAEKIILMVRKDELKGDPLTQEQVEALDKLEIMYNTEIVEVLGDKMITGVKYKNNQTEEIKEMEIGGVFVEIGSMPNSEMVEGLVDLNKGKEVIVDHKLLTTSEPGIFAAGDITDHPYKQNNISCGQAVSATLSAYDYIQKLRKRLADKN